jgi:integrase
MPKPKVPISEYRAGTRRWWKIDAWLVLPNGKSKRFRCRKIPNRVLAEAKLAKVTAAAFEGRHFDRLGGESQTVAEAWEKHFEKKSKTCDSWKSDRSRIEHVLACFGARPCHSLIADDILTFREKRRAELTYRGTTPSDQELDHEHRLLMRILNWEVRNNRLSRNPLRGVDYLRSNNVRQVVIDDEQLERLADAALEIKRPNPHLRALLLLYWDTGMRKEEILALRASRLDLGRTTINLRPEDTKTDEGRTIILTDRCIDALRALPRALRDDFVFRNPRTGTRWKNVNRAFKAATKLVGLDGLWWHDLRRSFITKLDRMGERRATIMAMSGHKTEAVFKRYNIVQEADMRATVARLNAARKTEQGAKEESN